MERFPRMGHRYDIGGGQDMGDPPALGSKRQRSLAFVQVVRGLACEPVKRRLSSRSIGYLHAACTTMCPEKKDRPSARGDLAIRRRGLCQDKVVRGQDMAEGNTYVHAPCPLGGAFSLSRRPTALMITGPVPQGRSPLWYCNRTRIEEPLAGPLSAPENRNAPPNGNGKPDGVAASHFLPLSR